MKALALALSIVFGLLFTAAVSEADDEPPDSVLICPVDRPYCH